MPILEHRIDSLSLSLSASSLPFPRRLHPRPSCRGLPGLHPTSVPRAGTCRRGSRGHGVWSSGRTSQLSQRPCWQRCWPSAEAEAALPCPVCSCGGLRERPAESPRWQPPRRAGRPGSLRQGHLWGGPRQWAGAAPAPATFSGGFLFYHAHPRAPTSTSPVPQLSVCKRECLPGLEGSLRRGSPLPRLPVGCSSGRTRALGPHCWGAGVARVS